MGFKLTQVASYLYHQAEAVLTYLHQHHLCQPNIVINRCCCIVPGSTIIPLRVVLVSHFEIL